MLLISRIVLVSGEGDTFGINGSFDAPEKSLVLILVKQMQNFPWVYIIILIIIICLLMEKMEKKCLVKANNKNINFPTQFCLESICNGFGHYQTVHPASHFYVPMCQ